jgi:hypothetical protein
MKKWLRKPLIQFALITAGIFIMHGFTKRNSMTSPGTPIIIDSLIADHLARSFESLWHRMPSQDELYTLMDQFVREEILFREAIQLSPEFNDGVAKKNLAKKMDWQRHEYLYQQLKKKYAIRLEMDGGNSDQVWVKKIQDKLKN